MNGINPALQDMIARKQLSEKKIELLVVMKGFIDRLAGANYISDAELEKLEEKYGVKPDIISWGDYFQSRLAGEHWEKSDDEFVQIIETVHFDVIASIMIFSKKDESFLRMIEKEYDEVSMLETHSPEQEESLHLGVLLNYYRNMHLRLASLEPEDIRFFEQYTSDIVISS